MVTIKFLYLHTVRKGEKVERIATLSRVPSVDEKVQFENNQQLFTVKEVIHYLDTSDNSYAASCFLSY